MSGETPEFGDFRQGDEAPDVVVEGVKVYAGDPKARKMLGDADPSSMAEVDSVITEYERRANALLNITADDFGPNDTLETVLERYSQAADKDDLKDSVDTNAGRLPMSSDSQKPIIHKSARAIFGDMDQRNSLIEEAFTIWVRDKSGAKNIGEIIDRMSGDYVEPQQPAPQAWPPKGARLVSDINKELLAEHEHEFDQGEDK